MSDAMTPVPTDHPLMVAWEAYKADPEYSNTRKWALHDAHVDGSLWHAFAGGFQRAALDNAAGQDVEIAGRSPHGEVAGSTPAHLAPAAPLPERILAVCRKRGWTLHWTHRGAYLHLESSELIEAIRGKHGDPLKEAADVLFVLMSITQSNGIKWESVEETCSQIVDDLSTKPIYPGEERFTPAAPSSELQAHDTEQQAAKVVSDKEQSTAKNQAHNQQAVPARSEPAYESTYFDCEQCGRKMLVGRHRIDESPPTQELRSKPETASTTPVTPALGGDTLADKPGYRHNVTFAERGDTPMVDENTIEVERHGKILLAVPADPARDLERVARRMAEAITLYQLRTDYTTEIDGRNAMHNALAAFRELEKRVRNAMPSDTVMFPVMVGKYGHGKAFVPWNLVAPHEKQAQRNHSQTLARLAERGGLSPGELAAVLEDRDWKSIPECDAWLAIFAAFAKLEHSNGK